MRIEAKRLRGQMVALKELEPFVRDGAHIVSGRPFKRFDGMRSREVLANWLICAALNFDNDADRFEFYSDPTGGDGLIRDKLSEDVWATEHVIALRRSAKDCDCIEQKILAVIEKKVFKGGEQYARGKILVVFVEGEGEWNPERIRRALPEPLHFTQVWLVGLLMFETNEYQYGVSCIDLTLDHAVVWTLRIRESFDEWVVNKIQ